MKLRWLLPILPLVNINSQSLCYQSQEDSAQSRVSGVERQGAAVWAAIVERISEAANATANHSPNYGSGSHEREGWLKALPHQHCSRSPITLAYSLSVSGDLQRFPASSSIFRLLCCVLHLCITCVVFVFSPPCCSLPLRSQPLHTINLPECCILNRFVCIGETYWWQPWYGLGLK